jgi:hypothetical protein
VGLSLGTETLAAGGGLPVKLFEEGSTLVSGRLEVLLEASGGKGSCLHEVVLWIY